MIKAYIQLIIFACQTIETKKSDNWEIIHQEIVHNALLSNILVMALNCIENHFHFLVYLNEKQNIGNISELLKNITLVKLKEKQLVTFDFCWNEEYLALSISPALVENERLLINQQQQLHLKRSMNEEIEMLLHEGEERYHNSSAPAIMSDKN